LRAAHAGTLRFKKPYAPTRLDTASAPVRWSASIVGQDSVDRIQNDAHVALQQASSTYRTAVVAVRLSVPEGISVHHASTAGRRRITRD
jgi:hypothetical protein